MLLDILVILIILAAGILGYRKGFVHTLIHTVGWVGAIVIAYLLIARIKADNKSPYTITEMATLIRVSALEKTQLRELITKPRTSVNFNQYVKDLPLFENM